ncbi:hypothetical protein COW57_03070 [Candidatus Roizmanbacteria bacterium CG17_big_fil_post_rev_8_21_14_2_50_39_7]|uniref:Uncharacterized protein n=1 Tax=Candidatus Roizmanbacteria bacterium CG17_big_fil_post_rev_8_21_14_2_50_39_7 TaxID=1974858 RepID=A0A2M7EJT6_9BACT|nr:MAG: hypothetical protein COW57_03070 [Candidatus Roizmanbacteria bacterium CG17_big_fil_post_rev_8_21_14_2_50_39_7]
MHCIILANQEGTFPPALLPMKGRAVIDYLIDDALLQKDITLISVITSSRSSNLLKKHLRNAFPSHPIHVKVSQTILQVIGKENDILVLQGNVYTSLTLQDFIRFYKQFKTITKAAFDKQNPKEIPFTIIPKRYSDQIDQLPNDVKIHTYNSGSGYNIIVL